MKTFVTGANGFIGRHLVARLGDCDVLEADLLDAAALKPARDADVVYHLAAQAAPLKGEQDPAATVRTNVVGTIQLAATMRPGARLVFASTAHVYAPATTPRAEDAALAPISAYGASKLSAELALRALAPAGPTPVMLRLFNVYGPGQSEAYVVARMLAAMRRGETPTLGSPDPVRDFVHVDDVVDAMLAAGRAVISKPEVVNVGTGIGTSIGALAHAAGATGARFEPAPRAADTDFLVADVSKARRLLGWEARVPLAEGLRRALAL